jgi:hypothetical protein
VTHDPTLDAILPRSAVDAQFRAGLLTDPHHTIEQATGVALPKDLTVQFIEPPRGLDALVILPPPAEHTGDLTLQEIEAFSDASICWETCDQTCSKSCAHTCWVSEIEIGIES